MEKDNCEDENSFILNLLPSNKSFAIYTSFLALQNIHFINCKTIAIFKNIFDFLYCSFPNILILLLLMTVLIIFINIIKGIRAIKTLIISNIVYIITILCYLNLYGPRFDQNSNINNYYITICMGIFAALTTFITIILVYYDQKKINKINELSNILSTINKTASKILLDLANGQQKYSIYDKLRLNMNKYIDSYNDNNNNLKWTNMLTNINIFILSNIFTSLYFSIFFANKDILNIYNLFLIIPIIIILFSVAFISYKSFKENEAFLSLPSPNDLLTPNNIIDIQICRKYIISKYLPMNLFYIGTRIVVEKSNNKFIKLLQHKKISFPPDNHIKLLFLFKYNIDINKIYFSYTADLGYQRIVSHIYPKTLPLVHSKELNYEYKTYIQPRRKIYMPPINDIGNSEIIINIIDSTNTRQYLFYKLHGDTKSDSYQIYTPITLAYFLPKDFHELTAEDIGIDKYHY